jgi:hypothetical protein
LFKYDFLFLIKREVSCQESTLLEKWVRLGFILLQILFGLFIALFNLFVLGLRNKVNDKEFIGLIKLEQDFIIFIF